MPPLVVPARPGGQASEVLKDYYIGYNANRSTAPSGIVMADGTPVNMAFVGTEDVPGFSAGSLRGHVRKIRRTSGAGAGDRAVMVESAIQTTGQATRTVYVRSAVPEAAGFQWTSRFGVPSIFPQMTFFHGLYDGTGALQSNNDPSTVAASFCGLAKDSADLNLQFMVNDGVGLASKLDLGFPIQGGLIYQLTMNVPRGGGLLEFSIASLSTSQSTVSAGGAVSVNLPAVDVALGFILLASNSNVGGVVAVELVNCFISYPIE